MTHSQILVKQIRKFIMEFCEQGKLTLKDTFDIRQIIGDQSNKSFTTFCDREGDTFVLAFKFIRSKEEPTHLQVSWTIQRHEEGKPKNPILYSRVCKVEKFYLNQQNDQANDNE